MNEALTDDQWSACTHCGTTNFSNIPAAQHVCIECNKEYLAKVAHTEED